MEKVSELGHLGSAYDQNQGGPRVLGVFFYCCCFVLYSMIPSTASLVPALTCHFCGPPLWFVAENLPNLRSQCVLLTVQPLCKSLVATHCLKGPPCSAGCEKSPLLLEGRCGCGVDEI